MEEIKKKQFELPYGTVLVKPVIRKGQWVPVGHSGSFMYDRCTLEIRVPIDINTGKLKQVLTREEQDFFEDPKKGLFLPGELSVPMKSGQKCFWSDYAIRYSKPENIVTEDSVLRKLDKSNLHDYLEWKVLMANTSKLGGSVAPTWEEREGSGTYRIVIVEEGAQTQEGATRAKKEATVSAYMIPVYQSKERMIEFLSIYWLETPNAAQPPTDAKDSWYITEIARLIKDDLSGVAKIIEEKDNYDTKLMIMKALSKGIIRYSRNDGFEMDEKYLGGSLSKAIEFLKSPKNQELFLKLRERIK